jgi:hypothetical protein
MVVGGLEETVIDLRDPADDRVAAWVNVANELRRLERPLPYIGSFGAALRAAAAKAQALPPEHRLVAAVVIVHSTAMRATRIAEFRDGIDAAASLDPRVVHPTTVIPRVLRPAVSAEGPRRDAAVSFAATVVLERIGDVDLRELPAEDLETLFEAATVVPAVAETLRALAQRLPRAERKQLLSMLP